LAKARDAGGHFSARTISLFWLPFPVGLLVLETDIPNINVHRIPIMIIAPEVIDDQAKRDQQFRIAVLIGNDLVVVTSAQRKYLL
jgi:hypothetical protein